MTVTASDARGYEPQCSSRPGGADEVQPGSTSRIAGSVQGRRGIQHPTAQKVPIASLFSPKVFSGDSGRIAKASLQDPTTKNAFLVGLPPRAVRFRATPT